ncbi:MAG: hypothetical protein F2817_06090 [Actinobacteria bacterium]|nr:hypothetical protein [Actinomycetota bacterium]
MRLPRRSSLALAAVTLAVPLAGATVAVPAASAQTGGDACKQALNPERRSVYAFKNGSRKLGFGRVVVTATKADRHRYCISVQFDGRRVFNGFGQSGYERRDGRWVNVGGLGDTGARGGSYTRTMQVPDRYRIDHSFSIRSGGRWYRTISISRYNL